MTCAGAWETLAGMKEFVAFLLFLVLICVGWNQPYKAHFSSVVGEPPPVLIPAPAVPAAPVAPVANAPAAPEPAPARDSSWLWKKGTLDPKEAEAGKSGGKHGR